MNLYDNQQLAGAKGHMSSGNHLRALDMLETLAKQYPKHNEIRALMLQAKKLSALSVPVVVSVPVPTKVVVSEKKADLPSWHKRVWHKFF